MKIKDKITNFLSDDNYEVTIKENLLGIKNYQKILNLKDNEVKVSVINKIITIQGDNLIITKLFEESLLIKGKIKNIIIT